MPDYQKMYLTLAAATEDAIRLLIAAQRECEEIYINSPEPALQLLHTEKDTTSHKAP